MNYRQYSLAISNSIVQYFNYAIFSISSLELSRAFMPGENEKDQLINFFASIILTVIARPLGSLILGTIGDKKGRKSAIIISGLVSSIGVIIVPFIPLYQNFGIYASVGLIVSRMIFLGGLSGEIDGIRIYLSEVTSKKYINFSNGLITLLTQSGALIASISLYLLSEVENSWRICFLIGGFLGLIFSIVRYFLPESSEYKILDKDHPSQYYKLSFWQILLGQPTLFIKTIIISGTIGSLYQFYIIFFPAFISLELKLLLKGTIPYCIMAYGVGGVIIGFCADKFKKYSIELSLIVIIINLFIIMFCLSNKWFGFINYQLIFGAFLSSSFSVPTQVFIRNRINVAIRYRIFSLSHSIGSLLFSTTTPYFASKIATIYGLEYVPMYTIICVLISLFAIHSLRVRSKN